MPRPSSLALHTNLARRYPANPPYTTRRCSRVPRSPNLYLAHKSPPGATINPLTTFEPAGCTLQNIKHDPPRNHTHSKFAHRRFYLLSARTRFPSLLSARSRFPLSISHAKTPSTLRGADRLLRVATREMRSRRTRRRRDDRPPILGSAAPARRRNTTRAHSHRFIDTIIHTNN